MLLLPSEKVSWSFSFFAVYWHLIALLKKKIYTFFEFTSDDFKYVVRKGEERWEESFIPSLQVNVADS